MERSIILTKDGSHTIAVPEMNVTYHSHHGAIQESTHVFIEAGLKYVLDSVKMPVIDIFEMGLGTALNALLTLIEAERRQQPVRYTAIELYPLKQNEIASLNYCEQLQRTDLKPAFQLLHQCDWGKDVNITPSFIIHKINHSLINSKISGLKNLVYYDSFAPAAQPEHWTREVFEKIFAILSPGGILVTYCSKSIVRRAMEAAGFVVTKIPGPHGKREMVRAIRIS
ncbi:MAG: tRNA (5-methylaminomethyl-2-thiouridine)(34)-methyltransferase MnmD [Chitinophagaceae bacterium]